MARRGLRIIVMLVGTAMALTLTMFFAIYLVFGRGPTVPSGAVLVLRIGEDLTELEPTDVFGYLQRGRTPTLRGLVDTFRKARVDPRVAGVLLKPGGFTTPYWGKVQEVRDAILDFRESGKPVYVYLEHGTGRDYYLASAADRIFLMPSSVLDLTGVASYELFLRGTLDSLGVYPDLHHVGPYKTAVNTFTERTFTDAHREAASTLTQGLYDEVIRGIGDGRGRDAAVVRALVDDGPFLAEGALAAGLVDELGYEDQAHDALRAATGGERRAVIEGEAYQRVGLRSLGLNQGPRIAVIYAAGTIASGRTRFDPLNGMVVGAESLNEHIRRVRRDASIRAVVLRIDSPGGSATASDAIWRELMISREEQPDRPIVASMSDLAASGGYYIAMPAHAIVAQPSTLTGSIGVFGGKFVSAGLYEKLGAGVEATSRGRRAEMHSPVRPYSPEEQAILVEQLQAFYDRFVELAAASRGRQPAELDRVAQGRVWTGRQALERGLVDELGGLGQAIEVAKSRAGLPAESDVEIVTYPAPRTFYEILSAELAGAGASSLGAGLGRLTSLTAEQLEVLRVLGGPHGLFRSGEPLALLPMGFLR